MSRNQFNKLRKFEVLEGRRLMAGDISFSDGVLTIDGDGFNDVAEIRFEGDEVSVELISDENASGSESDDHDDDVDIDDVERIVFNGFAGNDVVNVIVGQLDNGTTLDNVVLEFHGGENTDTLNQSGGGIRTIAFGDGGADTLNGSRFDDILEGGLSSDIMAGSTGNDKYVFAGALTGTDEVQEAANANTDTLDFTNFGQFVGINLATAFTQANQQFAVNFNGYRLKLSSATGIEDVIGSSFDDVITGNARDNHFFGLGGGDRMKGEGGNDILEGGAGSDTYDFVGTNLGSDSIIEAANSDTDQLRFIGMNQGLTIDLTKFGNDLAVNSTDLRLRLSNNTAIENVTGTDFADTIIGNSRNNKLSGRGGIDRITGNAGLDELFGGEGGDFLFSDAVDLVFGEAGTDVFDGFRESASSLNPRPTRYRDWGLL